MGRMMNRNTLWFYWGQSHMSFLRYMTLYSACKIHNDIILMIRRDPVKANPSWKEIQDFQVAPSGHNWFEEAQKLPLKTILLEDLAPEITEMKASDIHTADLLRWWLLAKFGGTVADMDIVFLKPLPEIKRDIQVVAFKSHPSPGYVPVSFMQGRPCEFWWTTYKNALKLYNPEIYESCGSGVIIFHSRGNLDSHIIFPWAEEYPWSDWHKWLFGANEWPEIPESCIGIHWYAGHNQKFNQKIMDENSLGEGAVPWAIRKVVGNG